MRSVTHARRAPCMRLSTTALVFVVFVVVFVFQIVETFYSDAVENYMVRVCQPHKLPSPRPPQKTSSSPREPRTHIGVGRGSDMGDRRYRPHWLQQIQAQRETRHGRYIHPLCVFVTTYATDPRVHTPFKLPRLRRQHHIPAHHLCLPVHLSDC